MNRFPWAAVGWFIVAVFALGMSVSAFRSSRPVAGFHVLQTVPPPSPAALFKPVSPQPTPQSFAAGSLSAPGTAPPATPTAGVRLLKCVVHGQVTYTNNPQDCPMGTASSVTVFPTQGYLATKP